MEGLVVAVDDIHVYNSGDKEKLVAHTTIRVSETTHALLKELAAAEGRPMAKVLADALERYRRLLFLERVNAAYAALSPREREALTDEAATWDVTVGDGLAAEPATPSYETPEGGRSS